MRSYDLTRRNGENCSRTVRRSLEVHGLNANSGFQHSVGLQKLPVFLAHSEKIKPGNLIRKQSM